MASRVVLCENADEVVRLLRADLLLVKYSGIDKWTRPYVRDEAMWIDRFTVGESGRSDVGDPWTRDRFGYLADDDDG